MNSTQLNDDAIIVSFSQGLGDILDQELVHIEHEAIVMHAAYKSVYYKKIDSLSACSGPASFNFTPLINRVVGDLLLVKFVVNGEESPTPYLMFEGQCLVCQKHCRVIGVTLFDVVRRLGWVLKSGIPIPRIDNSIVDASGGAYRSWDKQEFPHSFWLPINRLKELEKKCATSSVFLLDKPNIYSSMGEYASLNFPFSSVKPIGFPKLGVLFGRWTTLGEPQDYEHVSGRRFRGDFRFATFGAETQIQLHSDNRFYNIWLRKQDGSHVRNCSNEDSDDESDGGVDNEYLATDGKKLIYMWWQWEIDGQPANQPLGSVVIWRCSRHSVAPLRIRRKVDGETVCLYTDGALSELFTIVYNAFYC